MQVSVVQFRPWAPSPFQAIEFAYFFEILSHSPKKSDTETNKMAAMTELEKLNRDIKGMLQSNRIEWEELF